MNDPLAIARKLSAAQRKALLTLKGHSNWQSRPYNKRWAMPFSALMDTDTLGFGRTDRWRLTPLGVEVRAALERLAADEGGRS